MAIQIAKKLVGCKRVVGIAGGAEKCKWVESLGADKCVDYKSATFLEDLKAATPDYADVYYDNVGGDILNAVLPRVKRWGKIIACGMISCEFHLPPIDRSADGCGSIQRRTRQRPEPHGGRHEPYHHDWLHRL